MSRQLGKYHLRRKLGAGGMGEVWEAHDTVLDRAVAVKLLADDGADARQSVREAAAAARVNHPNAVVIYDAAECDGRWLIVMELVNGPSAARRVAEAGPLPWGEATRIARDAAAGLAAVHAAGLVHRDVKPANILLTPDGTAKVADFGLARTSNRTTVTGLVGTPHYMSPEQCWNETADGRADVYSLGATYFTLLTARPPFDGDSEMAVMYAHCHNPVPDPRTVWPDVPAGCAAVVRRAMAKAPTQRFGSAEELRAALDAVLAGETADPDDPATRSLRLPPNTVAYAPLRRPFPTRRVALVGGVGVLAAGGLAAFALWSNSPPPSPVPPPADPDPPDTDPDWSGPWDIAGPVQQLAIAPNKRHTAVTVTTKDGTGGVTLVTRDGKTVAGWPRADGPAEGVAFSPDGTLLAVGYRPAGLVQVLDVATGNQVLQEKVPVASAVAFSSDDRWLAASGQIEKGVGVHVWVRTADGWEKRHLFEADEWQVWALGFVPDRPVVVAAVAVGPNADREHGALHLWDVTTGQKVNGPELKPPLTRQWLGPAVTFAAAARLAAVSSLGEVRLFRLPDWTPVGKPLKFNDNAMSEVGALAVSPDGKWVGGIRDVDVHLWRTDTGVCVDLRQAHTNRVNCAAATPDGRFLLTGGEDGRVLVHDVPKLLRLP